MRTWQLVISGIGLGAGAMYALDPDRGRRRRALARDKLAHAWRSEREVTHKGVRDLQHRATGAAAAIRRFAHSGDAPDHVLEQRARAAIGRACSHPGAVEIRCEGGRAILRGPVLADEAEHVAEAVRGVAGIRAVEDGLARYERAGDIPGLQGGHEQRERSRRARAAWPPAFRLVAGGAGAGACAYGLSRGGAAGVAAGLAGAILLTRATSNRPIRQIVGLGHPRAAIDFQKTMTIDAPTGQVFSLLSAPETFPRFMDHVREVRPTEDGRRAHWILEGPAGARVDWDAEITRYEKNRALEWRTLPGSRVEHSGEVVLEPRDGKTRMTIRLTYAPPAGVVGHRLLRLLGTDPKRILDDDMARMKSLLEDHKTTAHHREVELDDLH